MERPQRCRKNKRSRSSEKDMKATNNTALSCYNGDDLYSVAKFLPYFSWVVRE